jgi:hypothetical protein
MHCTPAPRPCGSAGTAARGCGERPAGGPRRLQGAGARHDLRRRQSAGPAMGDAREGSSARPWTRSFAARRGRCSTSFPADTPHDGAGHDPAQAPDRIDATGRSAGCRGARGGPAGCRAGAVRPAVEARQLQGAGRRQRQAEGAGRARRRPCTARPIRSAWPTSPTQIPRPSYATSRRSCSEPALRKAQREQLLHERAQWIETLDVHGGLTAGAEAGAAGCISRAPSRRCARSRPSGQARAPTELARAEAQREVDFLRSKLDKIETGRPEEPVTRRPFGAEPADVAKALEAAEFNRHVRMVRENVPGERPGLAKSGQDKPKLRPSDGLAQRANPTRSNAAATAVMEGKGTLGDFKRTAKRELDALDLEMKDAPRPQPACRERRRNSMSIDDCIAEAMASRQAHEKGAAEYRQRMADAEALAEQRGMAGPRPTSSPPPRPPRPWRRAPRQARPGAADHPRHRPGVGRRRARTARAWASASPTCSASGCTARARACRSASSTAATSPRMQSIMADMLSQGAVPRLRPEAERILPRHTVSALYGVKTSATRRQGSGQGMGPRP